ncbi:MAG: PfkB family carbohydrate kinase, partial [Rhodospirillaceae bacterium]
MTAAGDLIDIVERISGAKVLCVGDVMLDRFVTGEVERISPEAPVPVLRIRAETAMLGGAGNVARNVAALGGRVTLVAAVGDD